MAVTNAERVARGLDLLKVGLYPFVERELRGVYKQKWQETVMPNFPDWQTRAYEMKRGELNWDTQALLSVMLGQWNEVFKRTLGPAMDGAADWSSQVYDEKSWSIVFIGGMWFQDLFNYELPNLHLSTAVVADPGLDPAYSAGADVAFSFKNAGGWRQIAEAARCAPSLSQWHREHGRHPIYANRQFVPIGEVRSAPNAGSSPIPSTTAGEELTDVLG